MTKDAKDSKYIPGTTVFTGHESAKGLKLNKFAYSLRLADNRDAFGADPVAYMDKYSLSEWEKEKILTKDVKALVEEGGGSIYMLIKLGGVTGQGLASMGAQQRGETLDEFMATRNVPLKQNT